MSTNQKLLRTLPIEPFMGETHVKALHCYLRKRTKTSFMELILAAEEGLTANFDVVIQKIDSLDVNRRLSPLLYFYYYSLLEALYNQNKREVARLCHSLIEFDSNNFYTKQLLLDNNQINPIIKYQQNYIQTLSNRIETFEPLSPIEFDLANKQISQVIDIIEKTSKNLHSEIQEILAVLHLSKGVFLATAATSLKYFGMIILRYKMLHSAPQQLLYFFDSIVHEISHVFLNLLMTLDPIVLNSTELHHSPARNVLRPLKGIFHAHFVFFRLIVMYKLAINYFIDDESNNYDKNHANIAIRDLPYIYQDRLQAYQIKFKQGEEILLKHAKLTKFGRAFLCSLNLESKDGLL
ncbi:HEXXH motif domain [Legionella beliardensis]|uniref:HEXXH motif domain n=1 Tax=Legionella beliardensis TaxID=91822 RepID=A0A378JPM3_9GAMM|nr:HEXXH motif-containing putative peptide modification protein [Legionella beliardensis]STX55546.1 HEXXH motif domain [Legionella beliardensis]